MTFFTKDFLEACFANDELWRKFHREGEKFVLKNEDEGVQITVYRLPDGRLLLEKIERLKTQR